MSDRVGSRPAHPAMSWGSLAAESLHGRGLVSPAQVLSSTGVSYWRVPHELVECWTLEQRPLLGSARHATPLRKRSGGTWL